MRKTIKALLLIVMAVSLVVSALACTHTDDSASSGSSPSQSESSSSGTPQPVIPTSIDITNELTLKPGVYELNVSVTPANADASFTSVLLGEHEYVSLEDNELAISEETEDLYTFTVEVASVLAPEVKAQKTFTVDNRPADGLHITSKQKVIDAEVNGGKLQLTYTMVPAAEVSFSLKEDVDGVSITAGGEITVDRIVNNGVKFVVVASATADDTEYKVEYEMSVKNEVEREISSEAELRAIWTGLNDESVAHMKNFYVLTANIELTSNWSAIGFKSDSEYEEFNGSFNGNGYTVSDFNMNAGWNNGFFYRIGEYGIVKNLKLESGKGAGEGLSGMYSGPFAGWCFGTITNCIADVQVTSLPNSAGLHQPIGTFVGTIGVGGVVSNCISLGNAIIDKSGETNPNALYRSGFVASVPGNLSQCLLSSYMLEGSAEFIVGRRESNSDAIEAGMTVIRSAQELMTASTFAALDEKTGLGFDRNIWRIVDGAMPCLINKDFVEPTTITVKINGENSSNEMTVSHGEYAFEATVGDENGATDGVYQSVIYKMTASNGAAEGTFVLNGNKLKVNGTLAKGGDYCEVVVSSALNPAVAVTVKLVFEENLSVILADISELEYTADGDNTLDLSEYVSLLGGTGAQLGYAFVTETEGVTLNGSILTLSKDVNNTATFSIKVTATKGEETATSEVVTVSVKNLVAKQISTADEWLAIWTGDNDLSRLHMHNNYVLINDIALGSSAKAFGLGDTNGYGFFGTLDGAGYTISWTNEINVGWNSGFIARVEKGAVVKNLAFEGKVKGTIAGAIGLCYGTVRDCFFNVAVTTTHASQCMGSAVAAICGGGTMKNVLSIGKVTTGGGPSGVYGKTHDTDILKPVTENCYALEGTVSDTVNVLGETAMKTAATFENWQTDAWIFADGIYPVLKKSGSVNPESFTATVSGANGEIEADNGVYAVSAGAYNVAVSAYPANAEKTAVCSLIYAGEGAIACNDGVLTVGADVATGETFALEFVSVLNASVKLTLNFAVNNGVASLVVSEDLPAALTYTAGGVNFDLANFATVSNASSYELSVVLVSENEGVSVQGSILTLGAACNNTDVIKYIIRVTAGSTVLNSEELSVTVTNTEFKQIATAAEWLAVWTGDNNLSRLHMHNNYVLTSDIYIESGVIAFGKAWVSNTDKGYGLFGTLDGAGHKISWSGELRVGWNNGFIAKIEAGGVVKNLELQGGIFGVIAGPVGLCYGTVENCLFNCPVRGGKDTMPCGSAVAALCGGGVMRNVISIGSVTGSISASAIYGKTHDESAAMPVTAENCYALEGTVTDTVKVLSESAMKTASTFEGWSTDIWNFTDGAYPTLKKQSR